MDIYGPFQPALNQLLIDLKDQIKDLSKAEVAAGQPKLYEHLIGRIKTNQSMIEKCQRKGYPVTTRGALRDCKDAVGLRVVCTFIDDIYRCLKLIKANPAWQIIEEKDYITNAKPNGYRSYHVILKVTTPFKDVDGNEPGSYYAEIQLRTIAMDSWASLEHEMKYKHDVHDAARIGRELKKCAEQLAACDIQMQTIRQLINQN